MDDQPEATVRAGHTGHGRILHEGDLLDCLAHNRHHVGASRVWIGVVAMTLPKLPFSTAVALADRVMNDAAYIAKECVGGVLDATRRDLMAASARRRKRARPVPRHAHQDPAGAEWLQKAGAVS